MKKIESLFYLLVACIVVYVIFCLSVNLKVDERKGLENIRKIVQNRMADGDSVTALRLAAAVNKRNVLWITATVRDANGEEVEVECNLSGWQRLLWGRITREPKNRTDGGGKTIGIGSLPENIRYLNSCKSLIPSGYNFVSVRDWNFLSDGGQQLTICVEPEGGIRKHPKVMKDTYKETVTRGGRRGARSSIVTKTYYYMEFSRVYTD